MPETIKLSIQYITTNLQLRPSLRLLQYRLLAHSLANPTTSTHLHQHTILVAFITSPLTFNLPLINSFCAFALPCTSLPKSASLSCSVTAAFLPSGATPLPTVPLSLRSMYHESVLPALFLSVKAKMAPPFLMASLRSASEEERERAISSKAAEAGNSSG
jgi:hypothetical protein